MAISENVTGLNRDNLIALLDAYDDYVIAFCEEWNGDIGITPMCISDYYEKCFVEV